MTSWVTDEVIDLFKDTSLKIRLFNQLHPNIELEILRQLEITDFLNLALTGKRWYQAAISAPRSLKQDLSFTKMVMFNNRLDCYGKRQGTLDYSRTFFKLVNKVSCRYLLIRALVSCDLKRFILRNRSHFEFEVIGIMKGYLKNERMDDEKYLFMEPFFDVAPGIEWWCRWIDNDYLMRFVQNHLSHRSIKIYWPESVECINLVLKQWIEGNRPNMEILQVTTQLHITIDELARGVEEFVQNRRFDDFGEFSARIVVSDLLDLTMSSSTRYWQVDNWEQTITFRRTDVSNL